MAGLYQLQVTDGTGGVIIDEVASSAAVDYSTYASAPAHRRIHTGSPTICESAGLAAGEAKGGALTQDGNPCETVLFQMEADERKFTDGAIANLTMMWWNPNAQAASRYMWAYITPLSLVISLADPDALQASIGLNVKQLTLRSPA